MTAIQLILSSGLLLIGIYAYVRFRSAVIDAILIFIFIGTGILLVIFPNLTNKIANKLGVGRGADLVFYLCILFFFFILLKLYSRIRKLEQTITKLARNDSIKAASKPEEKSAKV